MVYEEKILYWKNKLLSEDTVDEDTCNSLYNKILNVEHEILKLGISNYTKVPDNTITAKHQYYNLLDYNWDELSIIKNKIIQHSKEIIGGDSFLVKMWANVFRNGDYILKHIHHAEPIIEDDAFKTGIFNTFCGHLFIGNDVESETIYYFDNEKVSYKNTKGQMHFFSCIVPHEVPKYMGEVRVSIAFDVYKSDFFKSLNINQLPNLILIK